MTKIEFLSALEDKLSNLPKKDVAERIIFYEEMIDDKMEEGLCESDAIAELGTVDEIYEGFIKELPLVKIIKHRMTPKRRLGSGKIALIASTSVVWLPLFIALFSVALSLYAVIWSLSVSAWAIFISFAISAPAALLLGVINTVAGNIPYGIIMISGSLVLSGLAILAYYGSLYATKGSAILTGKSIIGIKNLIVK